jgi:leader peptidase (prepilin peptidase)/N-methyltransferase
VTPALVAGCAVAAGLAGLLVPWLVRRLPEPEQDESVEGEAAKPLYVDLAGRRGLAWRSAVASAAGAAVVVASVGSDWWLVVLVPLVPVCVALAFIDWHTRLLPAVIVLPATAYAVLAGLAGWPVTGDPADLVRAALGLLIARSVYWLLWFLHSAGMGFGDVRLAALLGFALGHVGWPELGVGMYSGFLVFGVPGLLLAIVKWDRSLLKTAFPFGPFMIAGALLGLAVGPVVTDYLVGG